MNMGKGNRGKRGKGRGTFYQSEQMIFPNSLAGGKGKGKGSVSSAKGGGFQNKPTRNPTGSDGQIMKCHECGSDSHLVAHCPQRKGKKGKSRGNFMTESSASSSSVGQRALPVPTTLYGASLGALNGISDGSRSEHWFNSSPTHHYPAWSRTQVSSVQHWSNDE